MNLSLAQPLGGGDLRGNDAFRVAGTAPVDAAGVFRRRNEGRDSVHVSGEDDGWECFRLLPVSGFRNRGINVEAVSFDLHLYGLPAQAAKLGMENVSNRRFIAGNGFDVNQLASERKGVHAKKHSRASDE